MTTNQLANVTSPRLLRFRQLCACAVLGIAPQAQALVVTLGNMNATEWTQTVISVVGSNASLGVATSPSGGNPDSHWENRFDLAFRNIGTNQIRLTNIFNAGAFDPGTSGALSSLVFSFDTRVISSPFSTAGFLIPAITQGGHSFRQILGSTEVNTTSWQTRTFDVGVAAEWEEVGGSLKPDFSEAGGVLHFGYQTSMSLTCPAAQGCLDAIMISGLDNFRVEAIGTAPPSGVPEPGTAALALLGLASMCARGRRITNTSSGALPKAAALG